MTAPPAPSREEPARPGLTGPRTEGSVNLMDAVWPGSGTRPGRFAVAALPLLAAVLLLGAGPAGDSPPAGPDRSEVQPAAETKAAAEKHVAGRDLIDVESISDLNARFRRGRGEPRLVLLLSPTCIDCIQAARWLERDLLTKHPKLAFRVYALWFHRLKTDRRDVWPRGALDDRRVEHFWEAGSSISRWYGKRFHTRRPVPWNIYFLYTAGADSLGAGDSVVSWGLWVSDSREKIRQGLGGLTGEKL
jgi:hypothetical protein